MKTTRAYFTSRLVLAAAMSLAFGLVGCTSSTIPIGDGGSDGGSVACGAATCTGGQVCCNASCGICTDPGGSCITLECADGGVPDGGSCGGATCGAGDQCCPSCAPDEAFCLPAGSGVACPDILCPPPSTCGGELCDTAPGTACCDDGCGGELCPLVDGTCPPSPFDCPPPPTCADGSCAPTDICCDNPCDGSTFCSPAGAGCPVFDCPPPPICGSATCAPGEFCCSDCGGGEFCSAGGCPAAPCPPPEPCAAQDARGDGLCDAFFGYAWNGSSCTGISGCSCVGTDCSSLYMDPASCAAEHAACTGTSCGGFIGATCSSGEYCDYPASGVSCGAADGSGACTARPAGCSRVLDPVCGCDGVDYSNECIAHLNGTDVGSFGTCASPARDCRTTGCAAGSSCYVCGPPGTGFSCVRDGTVCAL